MPKPSFFIAGVAKCGTTAMHRYLSDHPSIFMSDPKEPLFWSEDLPGHRQMDTLEEYLALFDASTEDHRVLGEASPFYVYSHVAMARIREFRPDAKIVVMLRNPVDQAYSFHAQLTLDGNEDVDDFEEAWRLQEPRARGENMPKWCRDPSLLQYKAVASQGEQVERLLEVFPREQVMLIVFDDFTRSTAEVYKRVLEFLDVPHDDRTEFPRVNESKRNLLRRLGRRLNNPPRILLPLHRAFKRTFGIKRTNIRSLLNVRHKRPPLREEFRAELQARFAEDVGKLGRLLGRDLGAWL